MCALHRVHIICIFVFFMCFFVLSLLRAEGQDHIIRSHHQITSGDVAPEGEPGCAVGVDVGAGLTENFLTSL
jgi:preprotein translocase subunit SecG